MDVGVLQSLLGKNWRKIHPKRAILHIRPQKSLNPFYSIHTLNSESEFQNRNFRPNDPVKSAFIWELYKPLPLMHLG